MASVVGGCLCGEVRYRVKGEPIATLNCHCPDCRRITGSAFTTAMGVSRSDFELLSGDLGAHHAAANSGGTVTREFCHNCGSQLFSSTSNGPEEIWIKVGTLDEPEAAPPTANLWTQSALPWVSLDTNLPSFETQ